jgi:hypothetical protein
MNDLINWLLELFAGNFAGIAAAVTVLLSIVHLITLFRDWTLERDS